MKTCFLLILLFFSQLLFAQDTLYQINGNTTRITTIKISSGVLYYRNYPSIDSSTNLISLDLVKRIVYTNGVVFEPEQKQVVATKPIPELQYTDALSFNSFDILFFPTVTFAYHKFSKSGYFSYKIPLSVGMYTLNKNEDFKKFSFYADNPYYAAGKVFSTGLDLLFYPMGQGSFKPYLGGGLEGGMGKVWMRQYSPTVSLSDYYAEGTNNFYEVIFNVGICSTVSKRVIINCGAGFGLQYSILKLNLGPSYGNMHQTDLSGTLRGELSVGYLFK
ncbi:MAG: hypothetical protein CFE21_04005 [Bacteroidetes bacterium B1(2017)]|nr:MAG: hypothetical protein CFE21_04005 [Bacteroidetes bacterium B1(2017)]